MSTTLNYRPEIDGLRAIAVVSVVVFHLESSWLPSGFLGVDIFFVISGYLITSIRLRDLQAGRFSIRRFYERRARRILPALLVVVAACIPFGWLLMDAPEMQAFGQSLLSQVIFASNILFWQSSDYFATPAETVPLLHTWSLAVEEQFYFLFPPILFLGWGYAWRHLGWIMLALALGSLAAAEYWVSRDPSMTFYMLPFRGWELLTGGILAQLETSGHVLSSGRWRQAAALAGLLLVCFSLLTLTEATPHPSLRTLPLTIGTCLILRYGRTGPVFKTLSVRPFVGVGLISYSLYLWHWPILAFFRMTREAQPRLRELIAIAVLSTLCGYLSWLFVEKPFRSPTPSKRTKRLVFAAVPLAIVLGLTCSFAQWDWMYRYVSLSSEHQRIYRFIEANIVSGVLTAPSVRSSAVRSRMG